MAAAVGAASPALKSAIIQCVNQPSATPEVQQAAIQAFRLTSVPEEVMQTKNVLISHVCQTYKLQ